MKRIKYIFILLILLIAFLFITISSYANTVSENISNNFFRLHILANSDSYEDQELKLKIRDNILDYMSSISFSNLSKQESIELTYKNLDNLKLIAENTIKESGFSYPVSLEIGNFYFPTKKYGNISLPAGYYDGLKINIGNANGQNWWCSLFPPLCFVDVSSGIIDENSEKNLKDNLSDEEFSIITDNSEIVKFKFKFIELISK